MQLFARALKGLVGVIVVLFAIFIWEFILDARWFRAKEREGVSAPTILDQFIHFLTVDYGLLFLIGIPAGIVAIALLFLSKRETGRRDKLFRVSSYFLFVLSGILVVPASLIVLMPLVLFLSAFV